MEKKSVILYAIIFLAVAGSYILHFTGKKEKKEIIRTEFVAGASGDISTGVIVSVDIDSLIFNFDMFKDRRDELLEKQRKAEADFTARFNRLERDAREFQEQVSRGLITRATQEQRAQALGQQEQELNNFGNQLQADLMEEEQVMNRQVLDYIMKYLEERKSEYNYSYVLGKSFGGAILYSESALNITAEVLDGLNRKYQSEKRR